MASNKKLFEQNKGKLFRWLAALLALITVTTAPLLYSQERQHMQLVNASNGFVVVEIVEDQVRINDFHLEAIMREQGIIIPPHLWKDFEGKKVVFLEDPDFIKAFKEVYVPMSMSRSMFKWVGE